MSGEEECGLKVGIDEFLRHLILERMQSLALVSIYNVHFGGIHTIHKSHYTAGAVRLEI